MGIIDLFGAEKWKAPKIYVKETFDHVVSIKLRYFRDPSVARAGTNFIQAMIYNNQGVAHATRYVNRLELKEMDYEVSVLPDGDFMIRPLNEMEMRCGIDNLDTLHVRT